MGQQQLLLLVLGMVIVGIAVVAGIQAFSEGKAKADRDAAISDAMRIISDVQAWKLKPGAFGGGSDKAGFTDVGFSALGISTNGAGGEYITQNGCFVLGLAGTDAELTVSTVNEARDGCGDEIATVTVTGTDVSNIDWEYASLGS